MESEMYHDRSEESRVLSTAAICRILGTKFPVPLSLRDMAKSLRVAFYPSVLGSDKLQDFLQKFRLALINSGVAVLSYSEALAEGHDDKIGEQIVLIAPGEGMSGDLAIDHVASLSKNTVVGILDGTLPHLGQTGLQGRVNSLVGALVWHMAHILIYVDDTTWTICTMNGSMSTFSFDALQERTFDTVIPKLAAPIVPPRKDEFEIEKDGFNVLAEDYRVSVDDLLTGADIWGRTGLLASQTKIGDLVFRSHKYRRIASAFLNCRTGMSYGFLAHQLPAFISPAIDLDEAAPVLRLMDWTEKDFYEIDNHICVAVRLRDQRFIIRVPEVSVLCTRSGCEKTRLDPEKDIVKLTLRNGTVILSTPKNVGIDDDCQPSFDTVTILSSAMGNMIVASILAKLNPASKFCVALNHVGLALAHWHGYVDRSELPAGYYFHGRGNPPVSCSTVQAAIFALAGKLIAFQQSIEDRVEYMGDIHEEPSHGTNATGRSLFELVRLVTGSEI